VAIDPSFDPVINDDAMVDLVRRSAERLVGEERVTIFDRPNMGVEDFGFYLTHVPGAFYSLGVRNEARGIVHPVHNDRFDVDEECLAYGAALQALNALAVLAR
jgi:metal-dependent amidase/aminoacylase/carboxypeptidase family protein